MDMITKNCRAITTPESMKKHQGPRGREPLRREVLSGDQTLGSLDIGIEAVQYEEAQQEDLGRGCSSASREHSKSGSSEEGAI